MTEREEKGKRGTGERAKRRRGTEEKRERQTGGTEGTERKERKERERKSHDLSGIEAEQTDIEETVNSAETATSSGSSDPSTDIVEQNPTRSKSSSVHPSITTYDSSFDSKLRHPNFHKKDERIVREDSQLTLASKIQDFSRYFIKHNTIEKDVDKVEDPYYYFTTSTPSSIASSTTNSSTSLYETTRELNSVIGLNTFVDTQEMIMTDEELKNIDNQFPADVNPFKTKWYYLNPWIYITHYYYGQIIASIGLFAVLIFGSVGYLIFVVKEQYGPVAPEIYEILSPYEYPHLSAVRTSLVDPDTPKEAHKKKSFESGEEWQLVFSDEFNADGRTFFEGDDQFFSAVDIHYSATNDLEYYIPEMVETRNGSLRITLDAFPTNGLDYRSAMVQSWNKLCFSDEAMVEVSIKMPGYSQENGLWPAVWSLGNLARPGYQATTDGVWPYTYDECDNGITPNQSSPDGISFLPGQRLSQCTCIGEDHPGLGFGRGAPEIDIIEGFHNPHDTTALGIQTLQVAPFDPWWRPDYDYMSIENSKITSMKKDTGTPQQEAIAAGTILNDTWFHEIRNKTDLSRTTKGDTFFQSFGFEYSSQKTDGKDSYIQFFAANRKTMGLKGDALHPGKNVGWRQITKEPMSVVFNLGLSQTWSDVDFNSLDFPAVFEIDYIRIYQPKDSENGLTCDPHHYPTTQYIQDHLAAYQNMNLTSWEQAGFKRPKNSLMDGCSVPAGVWKKIHNP